MNTIDSFRINSRYILIYFGDLDVLLAALENDYRPLLPKSEQKS